MLTLTPEQFTSKIKQHSTELKKLFERDLPIIIGKEAVEHFKKNFQKESWERNKWIEVKRRENPWTKGAKRTRKILTGDTGDLGRSIQYTPESGKTTVHSDLIYAAVHNWGLKAGRGSGFTMPQRKFIGESEELNNKIKDIVEIRINQIFSK
jgi:phage gpG-like protein